ncbi:MAG: alpha/beta hydrolase [Proteobacteria bacterium]|nr:alpha/beta hydrolase [Pseudomonadota bacterium]
MDQSQISPVPGRNPVSFQSQGYKLAGHLHAPRDFEVSSSYPAIVFSPPFNQVKEQTGAVYGEKLAAAGFITLAFDHVGYGESEGGVRTYEHPFVKIDSIRDAVSFLGTLRFVDNERLFGLGVCASGGYMALTATSDKRLKAIATVSGMMSNRSSFFDTMDRETVVSLIAGANAGRQKAYESGEVEYVDGSGLAGLENPEELPEGSARREGYEFYMTARAGKETYPTYSNLSPIFVIEQQMLADAQAFAPHLYTPYIGIYGERALQDTGPLTVNFHAAASDPKELVEIKGASHVSLYDIDEDVDRAVEAMVTFFRKHGAA